MSAATDLTVLRREFRAKRAALAPATRLDAAAQIASRLAALPVAHASRKVAGYWALDGEIALHLWQMALRADVTYCLPVLAGDGQLRFAAWSPGKPLTANRFGIPEPEVSPGDQLNAREMDLVVVPLVAFDAQCNRVGMGGGWYDRTFEFLASDSCPRPFLAGAAYELQQVDALTPQPWDVRLDAVCTESRTYLAEGRIP